MLRAKDDVLLQVLKYYCFVILVYYYTKGSWSQGSIKSDSEDTKVSFFDHNSIHMRS